LGGGGMLPRSKFKIFKFEILKFNPDFRSKFCPKLNINIKKVSYYQFALL
jgi:hypothetical protein